jgi:SAM-dependent methyltransferase
MSDGGPPSASLRQVYRGEQWAAGPARVYEQLARTILAASPVAMRSALLLDVGAGTGAVSKCAMSAGARVVATDVSVDMLRHDSSARPPCVVADILALPVRTNSVDIGVAAFVLNHLDDPAAGLRELVRVVRRGGAVLAATFAARAQDDLKRGVDAVLAHHGHVPPAWHVRLKRHLEPLLASCELMTAVARHAALRRAEVRRVAVPLDMLSGHDLAAYRLGMPAVAPFLERLTALQRAALWSEATEAAGLAQPYVADVVLLSTIVDA